MEPGGPFQIPTGRKIILEENFGLKRPLGLMYKVCYMQKVDISEIYPQQAHQAQGISEEAKVTY